MTEKRSKIMDDLIAQDADLIDIEPVAYRYGFDGYGWQYIDNGSGSDWTIRYPDGEPLYAHPPAARIEALSAENEQWKVDYNEAALENERLRDVLREVFEQWAGSEGFIPETAPEGYLLQLTKRMADIALAALGDTK